VGRPTQCPLGRSSDVDQSGTTNVQAQDGYQELGFGGLLTNADQGILVSWTEGFAGYTAYYSTVGYTIQQTFVPGLEMTKLTAISGGGIASDVVVSQQSLPSLYTPLTPPFVPILQRQDSSYVGTFPSNVTIGGLPCVQTNMVAFNLGGSEMWVVPGYTPTIATSDGGVIANSVSLTGPFCPEGGGATTTFDQYGNADGQISNVPIQSWLGNAYQAGSVDQVTANVINIASSSWPLQARTPPQILPE
jgi:hypothetical protein